MSAILLRVRQNNRRITRGGHFDDRAGRFDVYVGEGETVRVDIDITDWIGSATISSSTISTNGGGTVTKSLSGTVFTLTASGVDGFCDATLTITCSDGSVRVEKIRFKRPYVTGRDDYGTWVGT